MDCCDQKQTMLKHDIVEETIFKIKDSMKDI